MCADRGTRHTHQSLSACGADPSPPPAARCLGPNSHFAHKQPLSDFLHASPQCESGNSGHDFAITARQLSGPKLSLASPRCEPPRTMHDPFPFPCPDWLRQRTQPIADYLSLQTLPLHVHEVLLAFTLYYTIHVFVAPALSRFLLPQTYPSFNARTKLNWDVHIVSFTQSTVICVLALWVMSKDEERSEMNWAGRVHGYTGAGGLIQAFAGGYFLWDLFITLQHIHLFGPGMLAHAVSALFVFSLGFVSTSMLCSTYGGLMHVSEAFCQLLRSHVHSLRALISLSEYPLVLR